MSAKRDHLETTVSMTSGFIINYLITIAIFPVTYKFALGTSVIFFTCSYLRCYIIRRIFRKTEGKENE